MSDIRIIGIIPARYGSSRFPGKPLVSISGKSMILRVYEQCQKAKGFDKIIVATDDERIAREIRKNGGEVMMTSSSHNNGTERCAEVARSNPADYYINIQGDEPYVSPKSIESLIGILDGQTELGTLIKKIEHLAQLDDTTTMKVIKTKTNEAIYFSRTCIPFIRDHEKKGWLDQHTYFKHIGIYAYRADVLQNIVNLPLSSLEKAEPLEQLRWIENGYRIKLAETDHESISIDTPEDLDKLEDVLNE